MVKITGTAIANAGGAGSFIASGVGPASGVSGTGSLSGPFMIEEQTMEYDYVRVPAGILSSVVISLSGSTWTGLHTGTYLMTRVKAQYSRRYSTEWFETSSYVQPQRFAVEAASADHLGNTYCDLTPSDCNISSFSGTYGVAGKVYTIEPWYKRRPWIEGSDSEHNTTHTGYNYQAYNDNGPVPSYETGEGADDAEKVWSDFRATFATDVLDGTNGLTALTKFPIAEKPGTYSYAQDQDNDIIWGTDGIGNGWNFGQLHTQFGEQILFYQYNSNRHSWI